MLEMPLHPREDKMMGPQDASFDEVAHSWVWWPSPDLVVKGKKPIPTHYTKIKHGTKPGEMTPQLTTTAALAKEPGSGRSTHMGWPATAFKSSSRGSAALFWFQGHQANMWSMEMHAEKHSHKLKCILKNKKQNPETRNFKTGKGRNASLATDRQDFW